MSSKQVSSQRHVFDLAVTRVRTTVFIKPSKMFAWLNVKAPLGSAAASSAFLSLSFCPVLCCSCSLIFTMCVLHVHESFMTLCKHRKHGVHLSALLSLPKGDYRDGNLPNHIS